MMEWSSLQLKLISCRDLSAFNFFQKLSVYAKVSIFNDEKLEDRQSQHQYLHHQKTPVDAQGGRHPEWNHTMQFDLRDISHADHVFLKFKLRCAGVIFGKRTIGEVSVPFKDLIDEFSGSVRFVSYQIRTSDGKPNGVLNFSYTMKGKGGKQKDDGHAHVSAAEKVVAVHDSAEKPSLKADAPSPSRCSLYPSLEDDLFRSPVPPIPIQESYIMSPLQLPAFVVGHGIYHHPCSGTHWYAAETEAAAHASCSLPGWAN